MLTEPKERLRILRKTAEIKIKSILPTSIKFNFTQKISKLDYNVNLPARLD